MKQHSPKELPPEDFDKERQRFLDENESGADQTRLDKDKIKSHKSGSDFQGNLIEFDRLYEWKWIDDDNKILIEKSTKKPFSGLIHIQDEGLKPDTYPNSEQKIKFEEGVIKFIDSREIT